MTMVLTDDKHFHRHKNHSDTCSSWQEKYMNSNEIHTMQTVRWTAFQLYIYGAAQM